MGFTGIGSESGSGSGPTDCMIRLMSWTDYNSLVQAGTTDPDIIYFVDGSPDDSASGLLDPIVNSPHKWPLGAVVDFGDGSYGQRFVGSETTPLLSTYSLIINNFLLLMNARIRSCDGWVRAGSTIIPINGGGPISGRQAGVYIAGNAGLMLEAESDIGATNWEYNISVRYTEI